MNFQRLIRHILMTRWQVNRAFPSSALSAIEAAIKASESTHKGEIRFAVEAALDSAPLWQGLSARERAIEVFSQLRVWDTESNNGVLIYLLLADHDVEIVADRGISAQVDHQAWEHICHAMEEEFKHSHFEAGVLSGIQAVTKLLAEHFPSDGRRLGELPDRPVVL